MNFTTIVFARGFPNTLLPWPRSRTVVLVWLRHASAGGSASVMVFSAGGALFDGFRRDVRAMSRHLPECLFPPQANPSPGQPQRAFRTDRPSMLMSDRFSFFEISFKRRRRSWSWSVSTSEGTPVIAGSRSSRAAARYEANRALFLLLSAPMGPPVSVSSRRAGERCRSPRWLPRH